MSAVAPNGRSRPSGAGKGDRFPRTARLLRHADFDQVYRKGRRHFAAHMTVFYLRRADGGGSRIGLTVGKVLGGAVDRNRMKRRLREAIRMERPVNQSGANIVINPKKSLLTADFADIRSELSRAFQVIGKFLESGPDSKQ